MEKNFRHGAQSTTPAANLRSLRASDIPDFTSATSHFPYGRTPMPAYSLVCVFIVVGSLYRFWKPNGR